MDFLQRRRARFLIKRAQPFADEALVAVANFTWVGSSMGAQPGVRGRGDWAGGLPDWTLIAAGATRLLVIAAERLRPDKGAALIGSWSLAQVQLTEESYPRKAGPVPLGAWRPLVRRQTCCHGCRSCPASTTRPSSVRWESVRKAYRRCGADRSIVPRAANQSPILGWPDTVVANRRARWF
jgi:hypothetical protein